MQINTEEVEYCKVMVDYTADPEVVSSKKEKYVEAYKNVKLPGFRKGKASSLAIRTHLKPQIELQLKQEMLGTAYDDILFETKMRPIGFPQTLMSSLDGNNYSCRLLFLKKPDFELQNVLGLEVLSPKVDLKEEQIYEATIADLLLKNGDSAPYSDIDKVELGDKVTMDLLIKVDGKEAHHDEGKLYDVGANIFPSFDDNLLGMVPGETREFEITHMDTLHQFKVTLFMGLKTIPAELNDAFAVKLGLESLIDLQTKVKDAAAKRVDELKRIDIGNSVKEQLVEMHQFELPAWLVSMEAQQLAVSQKVEWATADDNMKGILVGQAEKNVKLSLILDSVRMSHPEAELSDNEMHSIIMNHLVTSGVELPEEWIEGAKANGQIMGIVANLKNDAAIEFVIKNVKIKEGKEELNG